MNPFSRADNVVVEVAEGKAYLVDVRREELITLNPVGTVVWEALDGKRAAADLADDLVGQFEAVSRGQLENDIRDFLAELHRLGLVVEG